jgi:hypothetical protein
MKFRSLTAGSAGALLLLALTAGCGSSSPSSAPAPAAEEPAAATASPPPTAAEPSPARAAEPEHIKLQHILVSFEGKVPGKNIRRSREQAAALAAQLLDRAKSGEDFDLLVKEHTDDSHPGIYGLSNRGVRPASGEFGREQMVPAFGDVGFRLQPGEVGMAPYDAVRSPYGWHVIKRIE